MCKKHLERADVKPNVSGIKSSLGYGVFYINQGKHYM
jgi:hypothetical protein